MNFEQFVENIDSKQLDQEIEQKQKYISEQRDKLLQQIDQKISSIILVKKRKLDYNAYSEAAERLKMFLTSAKNLIDVYFNLLDDEEKLLLYNFTDIKDLVSKMRFCLFRSVHNMNRMLIKQNETPQMETKPSAPSQSAQENGKKQSSQNQKKKKRKKGKNSKMSIEQTGCMYKWILQNFENPYPSQEQKQKLSADSKISISKVNYWFINMRERTLKKLMSGENSGFTKKKKSEKGPNHEKQQYNSQQVESEMVDESGSQQQESS